MWGRAKALPSIRSYEGAKRTFENTKPLRTNPDVRPLAERSIHAKGRIKKVGDNYVIQLYRTDIVTYYPNGDVLLDAGGYNTISTADAVGQVSPFSCWNTEGRIAISNRYGGTLKFLVQPKLLMQKNELNVYTPVNPPVAKVYRKRVRKDVAKRMRTLFKEVPVYIKAFSTAFEGGTKPAFTRRTLRMLTEVDEQTAIDIAWSYVGEDFMNNTIINSATAKIAEFWRDMYKQCECIEIYATELPYGEV